jgi:thioredoxin reductase
MRDQVDVVIVGGGPAGLSAALVLGRCRRSVLLFDHQRYRNAATRAMHGFLTRDGASPAELRNVAHQELSRYPSIARCAAEVVSARRMGRGFEVTTADGKVATCRKLVLATGVIDEVPAVPGLAELVGKTVFHCAYCDGWEVREQRILAYGRGEAGARFAFGLTVWSRDIVLCTDDGELPSAALRAQLERHGIELRTHALERVNGGPEHVEVVFRDGSCLQGRALFYTAGCSPASNLAQQLGAAVSDGSIEVGGREDTTVAGLYVAGDASRDALQAIVAAGEGSKAAVAINAALVHEDLWAEASVS